MNFQPRPQVCHPPPKDPPPKPEFPRTVQLTMEYDWFQEPEFEYASSWRTSDTPVPDITPGVYQLDVDDGTGGTGVLTIELGTGSDETHLTLPLNIPGFGTLIITAVFPPWDGSEVWDLGTVSLTFSSPAGTGTAQVESQDEEPPPP